MWTQFFLAMAYQRSGDSSQAREWLAKAVGQDPSRAARLKGVEPYWIEVVRYKTLQTEAESLILWDPLFPCCPFAD